MKKSMTLRFVLGLLTIFLLVVPTGAASATPVSQAEQALAWLGKTRYENLGHKNLCLDSNDEGGHYGRVYAGQCNGGRNQLWNFSHPSFNLMLMNDETGLCLDGNGTGVYMNICEDFNAFQRWDPYAVNGYVIYKHQWSQKCLAVEGGAWSTLQFQQCTAFNHQAWRPHP